MYYEEKRVDGVWYFRDTPTGEWRKKDVLSEREQLDRETANHPMTCTCNRCLLG